MVDISQATNIRGSKFDDPANPVAPGGKLDESVTPATLTEFVDFIDKDQLARFGLHTGMFRLSFDMSETCLPRIQMNQMTKR